MSEPQGSLRKAAILIASLDTRSADRLLDQMGDQQAAMVREAVMEMRDIDPAEQEAVIREFVGRPEPQTSGGDAGVELDSSLASKFSTPGMYPPDQVPSSFSLNAEAPRKMELASSVPVSHMLQNASPEKLAIYLEQEHPQLIAIVMVHLPPARAAEVLGHFPSSLRTDVMQRVAHVDETDPEVLREIEFALDSRFQREKTSERKPALGLAAAQAILAAANVGTRQELTASLHRGQQGMATKMRIANEQSAPLKTITDDRRSLDTKFDESALPAKNNSQSTVDSRRAPPRQHTESQESRATKTAAGPQIDFQEVAQFENRELVFILGHVDPQVALLALTGAEQRLIDRILKQLPKRDARAFREKMKQMGPLRISDVLEAQQEFAREAGRLIAKGMIHNPFVQRVAVSV